MNSYVRYITQNRAQKYLQLREYAAHDTFFEGVLNDLTDFGHEVRFSLLGGAGAYIPFAVETEKLDTPQKQAQFSYGFWKIIESGRVRAKFCLPYLSTPALNAHIFLHELMHFYQDMFGTYFLPLKEGEEVNAVLDAKSDIVAILFNEAWAQTEAIRVSWSLAQQGEDLGWKGAMQSKDWRGIARAYEQDIAQGLSECEASVRCFKKWYEGSHRYFYERHALNVHQKNLRRYQVLSADHFRTLELKDLIAKIPEDKRGEYLTSLDLSDPLFTTIQSEPVLKAIDVLEKRYGSTGNKNVQDIKCGAPSYIWNRLRIHEQNNADHPPMEMSQAVNVSDMMKC